MYTFKRDDVIILLGAGASIEAGIPHSAKMIEEVEELVGHNGEWSDFHDLYNYVRSSIYYADGIKGKTGSEVLYNIERLVNALDELAKRDAHPLYPFVGAWNPKLLEVAGPNFDNAQRLKDEIVRILRNEWVQIERYEAVKYYEGFIGFQREYQHPLRIFSLNYDLCIEEACKNSLHALPERGFEDRRWDWRRFDDNPEEPKEIFLYKLHGSADWKRDPSGELTYVDNPTTISPPDEVAIIFGAMYKLQYVDPFLFLAYEFRKWMLESRLIVSVGYSFGDEHINGIVGQALKNSPDRRLLSVTPSCREGSNSAEVERIEQLLGLRSTSTGQVTCWPYGAKEFMEEHLNLGELGALFPDEPELFSEAGSNSDASEESFTEQEQKTA